MVEHNWVCGFIMAKFGPSISGNSSAIIPRFEREEPSTPLTNHGTLNPWINNKAMPLTFCYHFLLSFCDCCAAFGRGVGVFFLSTFPATMLYNFSMSYYMHDTWNAGAYTGFFKGGFQRGRCQSNIYHTLRISVSMVRASPVRASP